MEDWGPAPRLFQFYGDSHAWTVNIAFAAFFLILIFLFEPSVETDPSVDTLYIM